MAKDDKRQLFEAFSLVGIIGLNMVASVVVGLFIGRLIDNWLDGGFGATIAGIVLGMFAGLWSAYKRILNKD
ncbi:MAG: AtpZ/AtpI family protein [Veillonellales bacterium]